MADETLSTADGQALRRLPPPEEEALTTAQVVGRFRAELTAEGIGGDTLEYLTQTAGRELIDGRADGLRIKKEVGRDG